MSGRVPRTHSFQWSTLVDFIEQHPEMVTHKFVGINGRENFNKLWEELTTLLNSTGFGSKDCKKWQEVFGKWKSKIKIKAQEIQCGIKKTGGGGPLPQLTPIEERLIGIIGWKIVTGDRNVEMGVVCIY
ncbi:unnamed protein product [Psylliodes chrysocephalus]|uniref:Regulatory protein zeste n=1 Tax=Psylliodes chrysocephalus TaxID=3402493 RepID=A0A9P0CV46_9CUCU|nr:unnamed protein product [Psylliodes chrysocephala]